MAGLQGFILPAQVAAAIPGVDAFVETVGTMPLLAGGSIMGVFEMLGMFSLMFVLIACPASQDMSNRLRVVAISLSAYFTIQAVLFGRVASEFLYFQF